MDDRNFMSKSGNPTAVCGGGASKYLADLPSRGLFSSTSISRNPERIRNYICDHDTDPPEDQIIRTKEENVLIRTLILKKQKGDSCSKDWIGPFANQSSRKRLAEKALNGKAAEKKVKSSTQLASSQEGSSLAHDRDLGSLNKERLQALLRDKGLSTSGTKAELIARLRGVNGSS